MTSVEADRARVLHVDEHHGLYPRRDMGHGQSDEFRAYRASRYCASYCKGPDFSRSAVDMLNDWDEHQSWRACRLVGGYGAAGRSGHSASGAAGHACRLASAGHACHLDHAVAADQDEVGEPVLAPLVEVDCRRQIRPEKGIVQGLQGVAPSDGL